MKTYFPNIQKIQHDTKNKNSLSYQYYDPTKKILGKTMADHLRIAVCAWHTFNWHGNDIFGEGTFQRPWLQSTDPMQRAHDKIDALFEFLNKLGVSYFTFHDHDLAPEWKTLKESNASLSKIAEYISKKMQENKKKLLWGTANLFSNRRYMSGASTNPDPEVFAYAVGQVKAALETTQFLGGENYVFWGGREGYDYLMNTDMVKETNQLARFFSMLVDYKHKIGFKGTFLIEPKPCEPTKHQYDYDTATVFAFLAKHGLEKEFKVNIEVNHATLAGHSFEHEIATAFAYDIFGSVDANQGDPQLGWDTDQFPTDIPTLSRAMYFILKNGGFKTGGFNFDTKVRRQSIDEMDLLHAHIGGIDALAKSLLVAAKWIEEKTLEKQVISRYQDWDSKFGKEILAGKQDVESLSEHIIKKNIEPKPRSGQQEKIENELWKSLF